MSDQVFLVLTNKSKCIQKFPIHQPSMSRRWDAFGLSGPCVWLTHMQEMAIKRSFKVPMGCQGMHKGCPRLYWSLASGWMCMEAKWNPCNVVCCRTPVFAKFETPRQGLHFCFSLESLHFWATGHALNLPGCFWFWPVKRTLQYFGWWS